MSPTLELLVERTGGHLRLHSPEVGLFTRALPAGSWLAPRAAAGVLLSLERCFDLVAPAGASGRIVNAPPERVLAPVGYGTLLYELEPVESATLASEPAMEARTAAGALVFRAPHSGRFWQRSSPQDPPFVREGELVVDGQTIGLIEVMKTFTHLVYRSGGGLPPRARLLCFAVPDGGEVKDGDPLLQLEPA